MKKFLKNTFISVAGIFFVLAIVLALGKTTFAQVVESTTLEGQIGNLVTTLEKLLVKEVVPGGGTTMSAISSGVPNPTCLDNYSSWDHSTTYLESDWNMEFMPIQGYIESTNLYDPRYVDEQFTDLNGDSLADYLYRFSYSDSSEIKDKTCVYLNNGNGFDLVYKCISEIVTYPTSSEDFYGDCADMS